MRYDVTDAVDTELLISDLSGRVVHRATVSLVPGGERLPVDISGLRSGVYSVALPETDVAPLRLIVR